MNRTYTPEEIARAVELVQLLAKIKARMDKQAAAPGAAR